MPHADQLILAGREELRDPATELFLQEHLRECATCRELARKVERADALIAAPQRAIPPPPGRNVLVGARLGRVAIASLGVLLIATGIVAGTAIRTFRQGDSTSQVAAPGGPGAPNLPKDWQLVIEQDLLIPLPPGWRKTIDTVGHPTGPDSPRIVYFESSAIDRSGAQFVDIRVWPSRSLDALVRDRFGEAALSVISRGSVASWRPTREITGVAQWSDARGSGSYLGRTLLVQVDAERVLSVTVAGPQVPSKQTEPTPEMRTIQELMIHHIVTLRDVARTFTTDQLGATLGEKLPLSTAHAVGPVPPGAFTPYEWRIKSSVDGFVRVVPYSDPYARRRVGIDASVVEGNATSNATARGIGNLVVWAISPDANLRYAVLTALDALLDAPAASFAPDCPRTRTTDATGVITSNGTIGIVGDTQMSSTAFNDFFLMVRRGANTGDRASIQFTQIGSSAPATSVSYGVGAEPSRTPWGDVAFKLGVKPIGFENSCWRLLVDGTDSGIVLFVAP